MRLEQFEKSTAGQLLKVGQGDTAYWAFVPTPLPPVLELDIELISTLSEADRALGELAGLGRTMANPQLLIRPFVRREAVLSSRIEGTQADLTDLLAYEAGQLSLPHFKPGPPEADVKEVLNYVHALEYGIERLQTLPISIRLMRELHERLMQGVRGGYATPGEFRLRQNYIGRAGCELNNADYVPPPVPQMLEALSELEKFINQPSPYPPLMRIGLVHYQFEAIHPFLDGNGRIGRLLISLLLVSWNLLPVPLLYLSAFFERHRYQYYDLLQAVSERGAWREWLLFFLQGVAQEARDASLRAKQLQDLQIEWRQKLQQERVSSVMFAVLEMLFKSYFITSADVQKEQAVTHPTANNALRRLEEMNFLRQIGTKARSKLYIADKIAEILQ